MQFFREAAYSSTQIHSHFIMSAWEVVVQMHSLKVIKNSPSIKAEMSKENSKTHFKELPTKDTYVT